jgi:hypothetical protein
MDYHFEIGKGKRRWSSTHGAHFMDFKDSIWLHMTKEDTINMITRLSKRLADNPDVGMDEQMPWVGYSGEVVKKEEW